MTQQDDITQRLRDNADLDEAEHGNARVVQLERDAADEIERLRAELSKLRAPAADQRELLPCPFCGAEAFATFKTGDDDLRRHSVHCKSLDCGGQTRDRHFSEAEAIAAWNRRSALASAPVPVLKDWRIDTSAGGPILVYKDCSVIESAQAEYVLRLIAADQASAPVAGEARTEGGDPASPRDDSDHTYDKPIGYLPVYELGRLHSGHSANLRSAKFGPSALDGDVPVYLDPPKADAAPQASAENVRNAALEEAAQALDRLHAENRRWHNEFREGAAVVRALKTQADKDGGQQRAGDAALARLAEPHTGMRVDYQGLLRQAREGLHDSPGLAEMLRQLQGHLRELGQRWYAGDTAVVDELLQLYCVESNARAALSANQTEQGERDE